MTILLERVLQKVESLPESEQDAIASQILEAISDEAARKETRPLDELF